MMYGAPFATPMSSSFYTPFFANKMKNCFFVCSMLPLVSSSHETFINKEKRCFFWGGIIVESARYCILVPIIKRPYILLYGFLDGVALSGRSIVLLVIVPFGARYHRGPQGTTRSRKSSSRHHTLRKRSSSHGTLRKRSSSHGTLRKRSSSHRTHPQKKNGAHLPWVPGTIPSNMYKCYSSVSTPEDWEFESPWVHHVTVA